MFLDAQGKQLKDMDSYSYSWHMSEDLMSGLLLIILYPENQKNDQNIQIEQIIFQISVECVFMCFRYERIENKAKVDKTEHEIGKSTK